MVDCATIRDLLPLYVDDVLSKESKALISGHIATCENCKNEFINMQSEIKKLQPDNGEKIDVLKGVKKKIFWQKVISAVASCIIVLAVAYGGFYIIFHRDSPIQYEEGLIRVQKSTVEIDTYYNAYRDDAFTTQIRTVLDLMISQQYYGSYAASRKINVNGVDTEIVYVYLSETLSIKWWSDLEGELPVIQLAGIGENYSFSMGGIVSFPSLPIEVYYLIMPFDKTFDMSDEDFYALRTDGVLLWSGMLGLDDLEIVTTP